MRIWEPWMIRSVIHTDIKSNRLFFRPHPTPPKIYRNPFMSCGQTNRRTDKQSAVSIMQLNITSFYWRRCKANTHRSYDKLSLGRTHYSTVVQFLAIPWNSSATDQVRSRGQDGDRSRPAVQLTQTIAATGPRCYYQ